MAVAGQGQVLSRGAVGSHFGSGRLLEVQAVFLTVAAKLGEGRVRNERVGITVDAKCETAR